jgi:antitoxin VapB
MQTVSIFQNRANQAIRIPKEMSYENVHELQIEKRGDVIVLRPVKPGWDSFLDEVDPLPANDPFLAELGKRKPVITRGRAIFEDQP